MTEKEFEDLYYQSCEEVPEHSSRGIFKEKVFSLKLFAQNVEAYAKVQRTWVGLTDKEVDAGLLRTNYAMQTAGAWRDGVEWAMKQLKEKNA